MSVMPSSTRMANETELEPLLVTKKTAAKLLAVSESTIDNMIRSRELPARQIRKRVLVELAVVRALAQGVEQ
jgi:excisionase family DNA binding protein